ncbi:MAG: hypothetical protein KTR20_14325 [Cellvibrionaceae bacterium]|nr:hypothetical protein [Cellvibrionaceae bacterium]
MLRNYYSAEPLAQLLEDPSVLMAISYHGPCRATCRLGEIASGLSTIDGGGAVNEVWAVAEAAVTRGIQGRFHWHKTAELMCVATWLSAAQCRDIATATEQAYLGLLRCFQDHGYHHLARTWHYLGEINQGEGDGEVYKQFCVGRLNAFNALGIVEQHYPAASALGHGGTGAVIFGFASRHRGVHHKNTLQMDAYHYPRAYGPSSPSFARATSLSVNGHPLVFVSGTASIVGCETTGVDDLNHQLQMTLSNIQHLLVSANPQGLPLSSIKAYVRYQQDAALVAQALQARFPDSQLLLLQADICRSDLLLEVECFCG